MWGWLRAATAWGARSKRPADPGPVQPLGRTLTATSRPRRVSRARKTSPMPPAPGGDDLVRPAASTRCEAHGGPPGASRPILDPVGEAPHLFFVELAPLAGGEVA